MLRKPFNAIEADLTCTCVGEKYTITCVVSIEEPLAPSLTVTGVDAFDYLMRHGQLAHRWEQIDGSSVRVDRQA